MAAMRPSFKKWREAPKGGKPFQVALFIRTEDGRTVECSIDAATEGMKKAACDLLAIMSGSK